MPRANINFESDNESDYDYEICRQKRSRYASTNLLPDKFDTNIFIADENEIHYNAQVDDETIARMKKLVSLCVNDNKEKLVKRENVKDGEKYEPVNITYIVNSPGGSVHAILDFVDYIDILRARYVNIKFTSIITGMVASAGTIMCVIADNRQMTKNAFAMIHELSTGLARTNYTKIVTYTEFIQNLHKVLVNIYLEHCGINQDNTEKVKELEELLLRETWMNAQQYLSHGFVHKII